MKTLFWCLAIVTLASLNSCKDKKDTLILDYKYNYYPLDTAHYVTWDVDSITYVTPAGTGAITTKDTVHFQWKEVVTSDTFIDNEGHVNVVLDIYRRADDNSSWFFDRRWYARKTTTNFYKMEDDLKFVKLVFPPQAGEDWNGNLYIPSTTDAYSAFANWDYVYQSVDVPISVGAFSFDSSATVVEINDSDYIHKTLRKEVYAKHVGLVYEEWEVLKKQKPTTDWISGPENGFRIRMRIRDHN